MRVYGWQILTRVFFLLVGGEKNLLTRFCRAERSMAEEKKSSEVNFFRRSKYQHIGGLVNHRIYWVSPNRECIHWEKKRSQNGSSWGAVCLSITQLLLGSYFPKHDYWGKNWLHLPKRHQFSKQLLRGAVLAPLFSQCTISLSNGQMVKLTFIGMEKLT